ncbi:MAG TPA: SDR family oxidoreductase [Chloroflexota bacterium]|nr:SDR family oxidoreductase [Chloroflexota bacterium]
MEGTLRGRIVLVTGAASGLGAATVRAFAAEGCALACVDRDAAGLAGLVEELAGRDVPVLPLPGDVADAAAVAGAVARTLDRFGRLDVVVNNAAIDHTVSIAAMTIAQWDQVLAVNLRGPFLFAKAALPIMQRQRGGHIVNVASTAATRAWANAAAYHASKWGLVGFSRALGVEGRPYGIRVTTIIPGGMRTHFFDRFMGTDIPLPDPANLQDPANVAATIVFAVKLPADSALQEVLITPLTETSWP